MIEGFHQIPSNKDIVNKSESRAKAEGDLVEAKEDKEAVMLELEQLANYKAELHSSCDFVIKGVRRVAPLNWVLVTTCYSIRCSLVINSLKKVAFM
jgi:hypothetical protein